MLGWYRALVRQFTKNAGMAGFLDALTAGESSNLSDEQAAQMLLRMLKPTGVTEAAIEVAPKAPALPNAPPPALTEGPKRGRGRPRKFQEPTG